MLIIDELGNKHEFLATLRFYKFYITGSTMEARFEVVAGDIVVGGEVVLDKKTGLSWTKRPLGGEYTFDKASEICRGEWRLPTAEELLSILDYRYEIPACSGEFEFTTESEMAYWTSCSYVGDSYYAWVVNFYDGSVNYIQKDVELFVRLVKEITGAA